MINLCTFVIKKNDEEKTVKAFMEDNISDEDKRALAGQLYEKNGWKISTEDSEEDSDLR